LINLVQVSFLSLSLSFFFYQQKLNFIAPEMMLSLDPPNIIRSDGGRFGGALSVSKKAVNVFRPPMPMMMMAARSAPMSDEMDEMMAMEVVY